MVPAKESVEAADAGRVVRRPSNKARRRVGMDGVGLSRTSSLFCGAYRGATGRRAS